MRQFLKPLRLRAAARPAPVRRPHRIQPACAPLEHRSLLSVFLADFAPAVQLRRVARDLDGQFPGARNKGCLPVQRRVAGRSASSGARLQPQQQVHLEPDARGDLRQIRVDVKPGIAARKSQSTIATYTAQTRVTGNSAVVSPHGQPPVALYSAPPSAGASMYVQFAAEGPPLRGKTPHRCRSSPARAPTSSWPGCYPTRPTSCATSWTMGQSPLPSEFTTGGLPANLAIPQFHCRSTAGRRNRPDPKHNLPRRV